MSSGKGKFGIKKGLMTAYILSFAATFMLFLYAPIEFYFTHKKSVWFDVYAILPTISVMFLVAFILSIVVFTLVHMFLRKAYKWVLITYFMVFIGAYFQGNIFNIQLPKLNGQYVQWGKLWGGRIFSILIWLIVVLAIIYLGKTYKVKKLFGIMILSSTALTLLMILTLLVTCIFTGGLSKKYSNCITADKEFEYSKNLNYIVMVVDSVDATTFTNVLNKHPEYLSTFENFTYYSDVLGSYPYDEYAIPFLLSGEWYDRNDTLEEYTQKAYTDSALLKKLADKGFTIGMYERNAVVNNKTLKSFVNFRKGSYAVTSKKYMAILQAKLIAYYYAPFDLKKPFAFDLAMFEFLKGYKLGSNPLYTSNQDFYGNCMGKSFTTTEDKSFKFIHLDGAMPPFLYNANMEKTPTANYESSVEATVSTINAYLTGLKNCNAYDNSIIVIMSDHGYNNNYSEGRQNPVLFIKGYGEKHPMYMSAAPISHEDYSKAFDRLLSGSWGTDVFDYHEGDARERKYFFYYEGESDAMIEYVQTSNAANTSTLYPTGLKY